MIGLVDIEYNTGGPTGRVKNDVTMIEFTLQIVDETQNYKEIDLLLLLSRRKAGRYLTKK